MLIVDNGCNSADGFLALEECVFPQLILLDIATMAEDEQALYWLVLAVSLYKYVHH